MLVLVFQVGADRYGLPSAAIEEVIALVNLRVIADAPPGMAGDFNYHGQLVPVVDLCQLVLDRPSHRRWSTRLLLTRLPDPEGAGKLIGLVSENATELLNVEVDPGAQLISLPDQPDGPIKLLHLEDHLDESAQQFLAAHEVEPPADYKIEEQSGVLPEEAMVPIKVQENSSNETQTELRRRRAPRLSHLDRK